jgi:hypothetical protein
VDQIWRRKAAGAWTSTVTLSSVRVSLSPSVVFAGALTTFDPARNQTKVPPVVTFVPGSTPSLPFPVQPMAATGPGRPTYGVLLPFPGRHQGLPVVPYPQLPGTPISTPANDSQRQPRGSPFDGAAGAGTEAWMLSGWVFPA